MLGCSQGGSGVSQKRLCSSPHRQVCNQVEQSPMLTHASLPIETIYYTKQNDHSYRVAKMHKMKLQVSFPQRATNYSTLWQKMTCQNKALNESSPFCIPYSTLENVSCSCACNDAVLQARHAHAFATYKRVMSQEHTHAEDLEAEASM